MMAMTASSSRSVKAQEVRSAECGVRSAECGVRNAPHVLRETRCVVRGA